MFTFGIDNLGFVKWAFPTSSMKATGALKGTPFELKALCGGYLMFPKVSEHVEFIPGEWQSWFQGGLFRHAAALVCLPLSSVLIPSREETGEFRHICF